MMRRTKGPADDAIVPQSEKLLEFKRMTHAMSFSHSMAAYGMRLAAKKISSMEGYNPEGLFQIGSKDTKRGAWAEMGNDHAIAGMERDGLFGQIIARGLIVWVYALWEEYRKQIGRELGWKVGDVMCDVMGDVRLVRNWIVHKNGVADRKAGELKVLSFPMEAGPFLVGEQELIELQFAMNRMTVYKKRDF